MRITIQKNIEDDYDIIEITKMLKYNNCYHFIDRVWEVLFRPNNKQGYSDDILDNSESYEVIEKLSEMFLTLREDLGVIDENN